MRKIIATILVFSIALIGFLWWRDNEFRAQETVTMRSVIDATGNTVDIPMRPKRVVILNASHLDLFCAAGGVQHIVGKPTSNALSASVQEATAKAQEVGVIHSPNVEAILALQPDLVIGINVPFHHALQSVLAKANVPFLIKPLDTYEQVIETLQFYGELNNQADMAAKAIDKIEKQYKLAIKQRSDFTAPKCLIVWGAANSFSMATSESFAGDLLQRVGGNNIADQTDKQKASGGFIPLSMEMVAKADPEIIFVITHSQNSNQDAFINQFVQDPVWQGVKAVQERRVYLLPSSLFAVNPGTRVGEALTILADHLYAGADK